MMFKVDNDQKSTFKIVKYEYIKHLTICYSSEKLSAQPSKYETVSKKGPKMALGGTDARLIFRKRVYKHVHDIPNDPVEYHLLYAEAVNKVVKVRIEFMCTFKCRFSWIFYQIFMVLFFRMYKVYMYL